VEKGRTSGGHSGIPYQKTACSSRRGGAMMFFFLLIIKKVKIVKIIENFHDQQRWLFSHLHSEGIQGRTRKQIHQESGNVISSCECL
jgi:hypothetical protein